ncbi:MAG TPA: hypothetical protein VLF89_05015 [Candidatus Saccharimonadales bacterium]|nr:hypothetical protein [Candidatus Saccharimonadales bacterium]
MKLEKFVLSIIGIFFGLLVAGSAFYFYQKISNHPTDKKMIPLNTTKTPTPSPTPSFFVNIDSPKDESVTDNKTITISGKTIPTATIIISTGATDQVITPSSEGAFSTTATIDTDENQIIVTAIAPSGEQVQKTITITYSTQEF